MNIGNDSVYILINKASIKCVLAFIIYLGVTGNKYNTIDEIHLPKNKKIETIGAFADTFALYSMQIQGCCASITEDSSVELYYTILFNLARKHGVKYQFSNYDFISLDNSRNISDTRIISDVYEEKKYLREPIQFYLQATLLDYPIVKYLSYYHVIEWFFQKIDNFLIAEIDQLLKGSTTGREILEKVKYYQEGGKKITGERNHLLICIKKYLADLDDLFRRIDEIDQNAMPYYETTNVSFATNSDTIINRTPSSETVYKVLMERVYSTRNSFVHSKQDQAEYGYRPYEHDKLIRKEIPLVQAIAELMLINSALVRNYAK